MTTNILDQVAEAVDQHLQRMLSPLATKVTRVQPTAAGYEAEAAVTRHKDNNVVFELYRLVLDQQLEPKRMDMIQTAALKLGSLE